MSPERITEIAKEIEEDHPTEQTTIIAFYEFYTAEVVEYKTEYVSESCHLVRQTFIRIYPEEGPIQNFRTLLEALV